MDSTNPAAVFRLLADDARLRLLRVLAAERLNVSELTAILGIAQSGVSRHLSLMKDARLVAEEREGGFTYFSISPELRESANGLAPLWALLEAQFAAMRRNARVREDDARLQEVLRVRKENFDAHAGPDPKSSDQFVPGRSWAAWARALGHLLPPLVVADLGCGEGYLTIEAARWAARVIGVDRSSEVLDRARALARRQHAKNITWKRGDIEHVPLADESVDVALLSQSLHHASDPARALGEAVRVTRPGGRVLILDLRRHDENWVRTRLGDRWLGFEDAALQQLLEGAGLEQVKVTLGARKAGDPFTVIVASGERPGITARHSGEKTTKATKSKSTREITRSEPSL